MSDTQRIIATVHPTFRRRPLQTARYSGPARGRGRVQARGRGAISRAPILPASPHVTYVYVSTDEDENDSRNDSRDDASSTTLNQTIENLKRQFQTIRRQAADSLHLCARALNQIDNLQRQLEDTESESDSESEQSESESEQQTSTTQEQAQEESQEEQDFGTAITLD